MKLMPLPESWLPGTARTTPLSPLTEGSGKNHTSGTAGGAR